MNVCIKTSYMDMCPSEQGQENNLFYGSKLENDLGDLKKSE